MYIKYYINFSKNAHFISRLFSTESGGIVKTPPLTAENWIERYVFYSNNYNLKQSNPGLGNSMRDDIRALINLDFINKRRALVQFCNQLSKWNLLDVETCSLIREEVDKQSINPIESHYLLHIYLNGAKGSKDKKRNIRLCKILLNKLYKHEYFSNFDQLISYLNVIGQYCKLDSSAKRRVETLITSMQSMHHQYDAAKLAVACSRLRLENKEIAEELNRKNIDKNTLLPYNKLKRALERWKYTINTSKLPQNQSNKNP